MFYSALVILFLFSQSAWAAISAPMQEINATTQKNIDENQIRVSIGTHAKVEISGVDLHFGENNFFPGQQKFSIECHDYKDLPSVFLNQNSTNAYALAVESPAGFITVNGKTYRDRIDIFAKEDTCLVVNSLDMEKYISGLINKEMSPNWPREALRAQAVSSRTYALFQKEQNHAHDYDIESSTQDQIYEGADSETPKSRLAAESTRGLILTWRRGPIKAFYHANCGGHTEEPEEVWGEKFGYMKPVVCPYHRTVENQNLWKSRISMQSLNHLLKKISGLLPRNFLRIASVEAGGLDSSLRRKEIILVDDSGQKAVINANKFRSALGNTKIKSTAFSIFQSKNKDVEIEGKGYGHGVGMCQVGARAMAQEGKNFREILAFYYPLAKLSQVK